MNNELPNLKDSFVFSCNSEESWGFEQFISEHVFAYQISGETHLFHQQGTFILRKNRAFLVHKNQFAKSFKTPASDGEYKAVSVILKEADLRKYAEIHQINTNQNYNGKNNFVIKPTAFIKSYFESLIPYLENPNDGNDRMMFSKVSEAVELLLHLYPELESFFFDFAEPHKINLEEFMLKNYHFNGSLESFAKLTGRSLATFKRDFEKRFNTSPARWLKNKRLEEAHYLIHQKKKKSSDIYIDLGFENLSHFYTAFKQKYGMTPTESLTFQT